MAEMKRRKGGVLRGLGGTLDRYVLRRFLIVYAATLVTFSLIYVVLDLVENLDEFTENAESTADLLRALARYYGFILPIVFCQVLGPIVCLTAGLFTVTLFQRASELAPMLANGRSYRRIFLPVVAAASGLAGATFLLEEAWITGTREMSLEVYGKREGDVIQWDQKFLDTERGELVLIRKYHVNERHAEGVMVLPTRPRGGTSQLVVARAMDWLEPQGGPAHWLLKDATIQRYGAVEGSETTRLQPLRAAQGGAPGALYHSFAEKVLETQLIPEDLEMRETAVLHMGLGELRRKMLESRDRGWTIKYYTRVFHPLNTVILLILGLPVVAYFGTRNVFIGALLSALLSAGYFVTGALFQTLGSEGALPAGVAPAFGPLLFLALAVTWLARMRT